eukprot:TRINITY_DN12653_c0_g5_i1.p2 TRINITY_DN12653_c0_g5~~TRINITY_DN12653_c0_g5_i1.p2  ORF type:complete len:472 (+),score=119.77 TRINITY_DN12653_c0_g5_i1:181-1596(+)
MLSVDVFSSFHHIGPSFKEEHRDVLCTSEEQERTIRVHVQLHHGESQWVIAKASTTIGELKHVIATHFGRSHQQVLLLYNHDVLGDPAAPLSSLPAGSLQAVLTEPRQLAVGASDCGVTLFDLALNKAVRTLGDDGHINTVAFDPGGARLAAGCNAGSVRIHVLETGEVQTVYELFLPVWCVVWSRDGSKLAVGADDFAARLYCLQEERELAKFEHHLGVHSVSLSLDASRLATGCSDDVARVWDVRRQRVDVEMQHNSPVLCVAWNPKSTMLATGSLCRRARVFGFSDDHCRPGAVEAMVVMHDARVFSVAWNAAGTLLATSSADGNVRIIDVASGAVEQVFSIGGEIKAVAWEPDDVQLAAGCGDGSVRIFDVASGHEEMHVNHGRFVHAISWAPNGQRLETHDYNHLGRAVIPPTFEQVPQASMKEAADADQAQAEAEEEGAEEEEEEEEEAEATEEDAFAKATEGAW